MQIRTLKTSEVPRNARVVQVRRFPAGNRPHRQRVGQSTTLYKPPSKWTVVAAFILTVALFAGAIVWVEMQPEKSAVGVGAPVPIHSVEG